MEQESTSFMGWSIKPDDHNDIEYVEVMEIGFSSKEEIDDLIKALKRQKRR